MSHEPDRVPAVTASPRLVARAPRAWGVAVLLVVFATPFLVFSWFLLTHGSAGLGLLVGAGGALCLAGAGSFLRTDVLVLTPAAIERRGAVARTATWRDVAGLGAQRFELPGGTIIRYVIELRDEAEILFGSTWTGAEAVAASLQARRFDPAARLDLDRALADGPRGDAARALDVSPACVSRFVQQVEQALRDAGIPAQVSRRRLRADAEDGGVYELFAVGRRCVAVPEAEWPALLREHFSAIARARAASRVALETAGADGSLREKLVLQLHPSGTLDGQVVGRRLEGTGLTLVAVLDLGDAEVGVTQAAAARWGLTDAEVLERGRERMKALPKPATNRPEPGPVMLLTGERAAARVLDLEALVELDSRYGALVGLPAQGTMVVLALGNAADLLFLTMGTFATLVVGSFRKDPGPLDDAVYWWFRGRLVPVPLMPTAQGVAWVIPDELSGRLVGRIRD